MHLEVTFRNLQPRDEIRRRAQALYAKLERFLDPAAEALLTVGVEHGSAQVEVRVATRGQVHKASEEDGDLRTALDRLFHRLEVQLRRAKERRTDLARKPEEVGEGEAPLEPGDEDEEDELAAEAR